MAALRVEVSPDDKEAVTRLAHRYITTNVHTWKTDVRTVLWADGHGTVTITRDGVQTQVIEIEAEVSK